MSAANWFPVDPGRYLKNTMHLTTRQHGGYWLLILAALENDGELPGNDVALASIAKLDSKAWKTDGDVLKAFLTRRGDVWVHEYAAFVCEQVRSRIDAKSNAGKIGAAKRWHGRANGKRIADASDSQWQTDAHIQEEIEVQEKSESSPPETTVFSAQARKRKTRLPKDWKPTAEQLAYAKSQGCTDPVDTAERFRLHHQSKGTLGADWNLGFQYWCRNEKNFRRQADPGGDKPLKFN